MSATPLAGIRVLEFSHTVMGPTAGLVFAELVADAVKVQPTLKGRAVGVVAAQAALCEREITSKHFP